MGFARWTMGREELEWAPEGGASPAPTTGKQVAGASPEGLADMKCVGESAWPSRGGGVKLIQRWGLTPEVVSYIRS